MLGVTSLLRYVLDGQVQAEVQRMETYTHRLSPCTILPKASRTNTLCHLRQISWPDKCESPFVSVLMMSCVPCADINVR